MDDEIYIENIRKLYNIEKTNLLNKWSFIHNNYPQIEKTKYLHRTILQEVKFIDEIKNELLKKLGFLPVHIFLTDFFYKLEIPGPYRHIEKGLLILYHITSGLSINKMNRYIPHANFFKIYKTFYIKYNDDLKKWINKLLYTNYFTNNIIRVLSAKMKNPKKLKNITCFVDGYDSRISYQDIHFDKSRMYSYKFKDSGYRTQFLVDINNFIMFISESVPCSDKTDGKMLEDIKLEKYINISDCILLDGGYTLHIEDTIEKINERGYDLDIESFAFPFRKELNIELTDNQKSFNKEINSLRSSIEAFLCNFTKTFERFNKHNIIRITESKLYNIQMNLSAVLFNIKNSVVVYNLTDDMSCLYSRWIEKNFDFKYLNDKEEFILLEPSLQYKQDYINNKNKYQNILINNILAKINDINIASSENIDENMRDNEDSSIYDIEKIITHKFDEITKKYSYLVKWLNYPVEQSTWVVENDFIQTDCIKDYWNQHNNDL